MTIIEDRPSSPAARTSTPAPPTTARRPVSSGGGKTPGAARRRNRLAAGLALGAVAVGGNLLAYASLDDRQPVLQVTDNIAAGAVITPDMLRIVNVSGDAITTVDASMFDSIVGQHARVHIISGTLLSSVQVQSEPPIASDKAVVAVQVSNRGLPNGLRTQAHVQLVVPAKATITDEAPEPIAISGEVVELSETGTGINAERSVSVAVDLDVAAFLAASNDVRIVVLPPDASETP